MFGLACCTFPRSSSERRIVGCRRSNSRTARRIPWRSQGSIARLSGGPGFTCRQTGRPNTPGTEKRSGSPAIVGDMARRDGHSLTAISGKIHLATRAVMDLGNDFLLNQLVASGIAHRAPPRGWARFLGALAWLGEAPLPDSPIRIRPLLGLKSRNVAEHNYLLLDRSSGDWLARWDLEMSGLTAPLSL